MTISDRLPDPPPVDAAVASVEDSDGRSPMLEIANAIVRLYKEAHGRGPTKVRVQFAGPDALVVLLEDTLTVAERNLVALGEDERLREARLFFQRALEQEFRTVVERSLGRRTIAFISGIDTRRDVAVELFTLEPDPEPDASLETTAAT